MQEVNQMDGPSVAVQVPWSLDLRIAAVWGVLAGLSAVALMPYLMQLTPQVFEKLRIPLPAFVALQGIQAFALLGLMSLLGLRMGHRVGLGSPLLQGWLDRNGSAPNLHTLKPLQAITLGVLGAVAVLGASLLLDPMLPKPLHPVADPGAGQSALNGLLASFYGGIAEELQLRLFLMTLLVWVFAKASRRQPGATVFWIAIVIAAVLFGAGHLPAAAQVWGLTDIVVFRTIALNAIAALAFGWLYWKRGIEMAMLGHFSADIVLHVIAPALSVSPA
jgi:hypothetical protein